MRSLLRNMIGPCDEGNVTGGDQPVKPTFDPLKPTVDVALSDFGGVWSKFPKVPRTAWRAGERWPQRAPAGDRRSSGRPCRTSDDEIPLPATMLLYNA